MSNATAPPHPTPPPRTPAPQAASPATACSRRPNPILATLAIVASALSMLTACASGPPPVVASYPAPPASLIQPCSLPPAEPDSGHPAHLLANHVQWTSALHRCRARHSDLTDWIRAIRQPPR